jgi:hypothetical protein
MMRVGLSNGVQVLVHCRAQDTDSAVIRRALMEGNDGDPTVSIDWMLSETELSHPPPGRFVHPMQILETSAEQRGALQSELSSAERRLAELYASPPASPIDAARLSQRIEETESRVATLRGSVSR